MSELPPSAENVFNKDYWSPITKPATSVENKYFFALGLRGRPCPETDLLLAQAATALFAGEALEPVPSRTQLDYASDNPYTSPGKVLLTDTEVLTPGKPKVDYLDASLPESDVAISASAVLLFKHNAQQYETEAGEPILVADTGEGVFFSSEHIMSYKRIVRLLVFGYDKKGSPQGTYGKHWSIADASQVAGSLGAQVPLPHTRLIEVLSPIIIGQSYDIGTRKKTAVMRIKSAAVCFRGTLQHQRAKQRQPVKNKREGLAPVINPA